MLNKLHEYCSQWNLKVNIDKTNVIVFRNGGYLRKYEKWFYGNIQLKVVTYYKYLGLVISSRLAWYMCQKTLAEQAAKTLFGLKASLNKFGVLSANLLFKIFDTNILPILTYGAEIWFSHDSPDIEKDHHHFCKYVLRIPKRSPNIFARGELGRYSVFTNRCLKLVKYWLRILNMDENRYPKICYKLQCKWLKHNSRTDCWARHVKELLEGNGFGYVWYNQDVNDERSFISAFKERLLDIDIQCWRYDIEEMNKLRTYRLLKENLTCEIYLNEINIATYRKAITKLRGGLLDLRANTGRYENIPYEDRICLMCKTSIEDEFHFIFECNNYGSIRQNFIPEYYYVHPSYEKFKDLMTRRKHDTLLNIARYVIVAMKHRESFITATS